MSEFLFVLMLALVPALGNFAGGLLAELVHVPPRHLSNALHAAAGVVLAVVAVEIMPAALAGAPAWGIAAAFLLGALFYLLIDAAVQRLGAGGNAGGAGMWMIYAAVSMDLFGDGLLIGTGSAVSSALALVLALGQTLADVPEGFATVANFKDKGVPRRRRLLLSASFALPVVLAAALGYLLLRGRAEALQLSALVFTAGVITVAAVEEMIAEAHESSTDTRTSVLAFAGGFALFVLVAGYLD